MGLVSHYNDPYKETTLHPCDPFYLHSCWVKIHATTTCRVWNLVNRMYTITGSHLGCGEEKHVAEKTESGVEKRKSGV